MNKITTSPQKAKLQDYFNGVGFERWSAIYGQAEVSSIRRTVREGHEQMLALARSWLGEKAESGTLLDAGCGTGLFSLAMAQSGMQVTAVDIAPRMIEAAQAAASNYQLDDRITFITGDTDQVSGKFDVIACFDVLVHYELNAFTQLCTSLAAKTKDTLLLTYAPYSHLFAALHWIGGHFPNGSKRTEIQMIRDSTVQRILSEAGLQVKQTQTISHGFYHVRLLEAVVV